MQNLKLVPLGYQQILATTLAAATPLAVPAGAQVAVIRSETANVRWRDDGTAPTSGIGMPLNSTDTVPFEYWGTLSAIQFIAVSGSPILDVSYYRIAG
jgi:hypothetical protein